MSKLASAYIATQEEWNQSSFKISRNGFLKQFWTQSIICRGISFQHPAILRMDSGYLSSTKTEVNFF